MRTAALALVGALALGGCGSGGAASERLTVAAAASLKGPLTAHAAAHGAGEVRFSFGGSDLLAAQIRQGVRPDVFAAADARLAQALHREGLVEAPVVFATNRLAVAVRPSEFGELSDLTTPGVRIAVGARGVPVGEYTRRLLARLPAVERRALEANVRTREPDVAGAMGKLLQGAVDAAFVYETDVAAQRGRVRAIALPDQLQPDIRYAAAVVRGTPRREAARAFVAGLRDARALRAAGFGAAP